MIYRVVTYDGVTGRTKGKLPIPAALLRKAKRIAGFQPRDDGLGEYLLNEEQTREIGRLIGFRPEPGRFYYCVEPYQSPEDSRFQQAAEDLHSGVGGRAKGE